MLAAQIAVLFALTLLNGVFAMSELAVVSSRKARLQTLADTGSAGARTALRLAEDPSRFLSTVQIGITMVGIVAGAYGGSTLGERLGAWLVTLPGLAEFGRPLGVGLVIVTITYTSIVLGELIPKRVALRNPEAVAALIARPMLLLSRAAAPFVWLLGVSTDGLLRLLGLAGGREETVTEEEVRSMISEGTLAGIFDPREKEMIDGVLRIADLTVRAVMTPRPDVVWLDVGDAPEVVIPEVIKAGHSRFPICRGDLDEVVGVVHARDLLEAGFFGKSLNLPGLAAEALVVHDRTPVLRLLDLIKQSGQHMAIVVDEYGTVEGICTVTDILEAIAGDLPEGGEPADADGVVRRADGSWLVEGWLPVEQVEAATGLKGLRAEGSSYHTLAGFVLHQLGHVPVAGETVTVCGIRFEVVDMDGRRIDKVLIAPPADAAPVAECAGDAA